MIYRMDPKTWTVEHMFPTVGFRPNGIGIETPDAKFLWESDTNMGAFFKRDDDRRGGRFIVLPEGSAFPRRTGLQGLTSTGLTISARQRPSAADEDLGSGLRT
jgi:sugar lactone lactonase YvrE